MMLSISTSARLSGRSSERPQLQRPPCVAAAGRGSANGNALLVSPEVAGESEVPPCAERRAATTCARQHKERSKQVAPGGIRGRSAIAPP